MRRPWREAILIVAAAIAVNLVIAILAAQTSSSPPSDMVWAKQRAIRKIMSEPNSTPPYWPEFVYEGWGVSIIGVNPPGAAERLPGASYMEVSLNVGWPFRCLRAAAIWPQTWDDEPSVIALLPRLDGRGNTYRPHLPTRPMWTGLALNTTVYALAIWLVLFRPFAMRRRLRIKRGLCGRCAYPIGVSAVCTECGEPVPPGANLRPQR